MKFYLYFSNNFYLIKINLVIKSTNEEYYSQKLNRFQYMHKQFLFFCNHLPSKYLKNCAIGFDTH